jgi:hypothetical protein
MFQFNIEFERDCLALRPLERTRALNPALQNFDAWLEDYKEQIPLE